MIVITLSTVKDCCYIDQHESKPAILNRYY